MLCPTESNLVDKMIRDKFSTFTVRSESYETVVDLRADL